MPNEAYGFGLAAFGQKIYFVPNDEGQGQITSTDVFDLDNPNAGWVTHAQMNYRRSQVQLIVCEDLIYALGGFVSDFTRFFEKIRVHDFFPFRKTEDTLLQLKFSIPKLKFGLKLIP